ncbi:prepilin peptidase [Campylobacter sp. faydin G-24]|uniref:Prepilin peptidase n=1 Tax=Campylobacter anatolicus TaxID=2829105 RepID=A0ABS5HIC2_9BACT|nr:A24 family peptidase [Campylobacter anatolicus]MBR8462945.1 prepilin peptidase [Campylobacter anatolicus]MBR8464021.1 prepilin peptidase [Campylobacter anatolicus]MBR8465791.1 prepilin peptidase [Campylobacter anatolicus]
MSEFVFCVVVFFIFGVCIGSFANVLIYRLPRNKSVFKPPSHCTNCKRSLKFYHNVPILSWLFLRGHCGFCGVKISPLYPLVELSSGVLMSLVFLIEIKTNLNSTIIDAQTLISTILIGFCFIFLLALSVIDLQFKAVPDSLLFSALGVAIIYAITQFFWFGLFELLLNSVFFMAGFWLLRYVVSKLIRREAMGSADIFIAGIIGAILPLNLGLVAICIAAVMTLPFYLFMQDKELAFVPFLNAGLVIVYAFGDKFINFLGKLYE